VAQPGRGEGRRVIINCNYSLHITNRNILFYLLYISNIAFLFAYVSFVSVHLPIIKMRYFCWKIVKIAERWGLRPRILAITPMTNSWLRAWH